MSQIAFFIGSFSIYWFGIIIAVALLAATAVAVLCRKMQGKDSRAVLLWLEQAVFSPSIFHA